jgi:hypothetical protein
MSQPEYHYQEPSRFSRLGCIVVCALALSGAIWLIWFLIRVFIADAPGALR